MRRTRKFPRVGDRVIVDFGGFDHEGEVVRVPEFGTHARIMVEIWLEGMDEPTLVLHTVDEVRPVEPAAN